MVRAKLKVSPSHKALMRSVRFTGKRIGIEFTTIPPNLYWGREYGSGGCVERMETLLSGNNLIMAVGVDPGCIEIPSTIITDWEDVIAFSRTVLMAADDAGCLQESPFSTGGGGHIHVSSTAWPVGLYLDESEETGYRIQRWMTLRPWIAWAMNDSSDNTEALNGCASNMAASPRSQTTEFRFFDGAVSVNEQIEHVALALKLFTKARQLRGEVRYHDLPNVPKLTLKQALEGWEQTIREFSLPWKLYQHYSRNIRERYQLGRRYLN